MSKSSKPAVKSDWEMEDVIADILNQSTANTSKVVKMLEQGKSVPFIARYRRDHIGNMKPEVIHLIKEKVDDLRTVKESIRKAIKNISKTGQLTSDLESALKQSKTIEEVAFITDPFKKKGAHSLADRARQNGLEPLAAKILNSTVYFPFMQEISQETRNAYKNESDIETAIEHIIADSLSRNREVTQELESLIKVYQPIYETKKSRTVEKNVEIKENELKTYEQYFDFKLSLDRIKPHQILAINRGEANKILSVKILLQDQVKAKYMSLIDRLVKNSPPEFVKIIKSAACGAWDRLLVPFITRTIRCEMKKRAQVEALRVFASNLRHVLMTAPVRGLPILGIDPGFKNGCKLAVINACGDVVTTGIFYLRQPDKAASVLSQIVHTFNVATVALGDGQGSRDTANLLGRLIKTGVFSPINVRFSIISESAASVYSASYTGLQDLPDLDVSLRGAVSIARRMQDPLAEMVKMNPKNLGVGMYQHDLSEKQLLSAVNYILEECISFVGVDLNTAPQHLLKRVSGLSDAQATAIVKYRQTNGSFVNRDQLKKVKGIGEITFEQCAGFVTIKRNNQLVPRSIPSFPTPPIKEEEEKMDISPDSSLDDFPTKPVISRRKRHIIFSSSEESESEAQPTRKRKKLVKGASLKNKNCDKFECNPLDQTTIHPESYSVAERIIKELGFSPEQIGCDELLSKCGNILKSEEQLRHFVSDQTGLETVRYIVECLSRPLDFDIRQNHFGPLFRDSVKSIADLHPDMPVIGRVVNVTTFGAFVDIGVENHALLHLSRFPRCHSDPTRMVNREEMLKLGDVIHALIESIKDNRKLSLKGARLVDPSEIDYLVASSKLSSDHSRTFTQPNKSMNIKNEPSFVPNKSMDIKNKPSFFPNKSMDIKNEPSFFPNKLMDIKNEPSFFPNKSNIRSESRFVKQLTPCRTPLLDLNIGDKVIGVIKNIIDYAAFVDFGAECDGFVHISQLPKLKSGVPGDRDHGPLKVGDQVEAILDDVKVEPRKIKLRKLRII